MDTFYIEALECSNEISKDIALLDIMELQYEQMYKDAEYKVMAENGNASDLEYLYTEADKEMGEQKESVLSKIVNGLKSLIQKIIDSISDFFNKSKKPDPDAKITIPAKDWEEAKACEEFAKNPGTKLMDAIKNHKKTAIAIGAGAAVAGTVIIDGARGWKLLENIKKGLEKAKGGTIDKLFANKGVNQNEASKVTNETTTQVVRTVKNMKDYFKDENGVDREVEALKNKYPGKKFLRDKHGTIRKWSDKQSGAIEWKDGMDIDESAKDLENFDATTYVESIHDEIFSGDDNDDDVTDIERANFAESVLTQIEQELFESDDDVQDDVFDATTYVESIHDEIFGDDEAMIESAKLFGDEYYVDEDKDNLLDDGSKEILDAIKNL